MRSTVLVSLGASLVSAVTTALIFAMTLPGLVDAQVARITAVGLTVVSANGLEGVNADVKATGGGGLNVLGVDGKTVRISLGAGGGPAGQPTSAENGGLSVYDVNGAQVGRVGTLGSLPGYPTGVQLWDTQGHVRYRAYVDPDGNPSIQLFDADGQVIWSAPS